MICARQWQPFSLSWDTHNSIRERIWELGRRLQDISLVLQMSRVASEQSRYTYSYPYGYYPYSLLQGPLGLALMYHELATEFPDEHWDQTASSYFGLLPRTFSAVGSHALGFLSGIGGAAFVAQQLAQQEGRYWKICEQVLSVIMHSSFKYAFPTEDLRLEKYDLTDGLVGISTLLLTVLMKPEAQKQPELQETLTQLRFFLPSLTQLLVWLTRCVVDDTSGPYSHWWDVSSLYPLYTQNRLEGQLYWGNGMRQGLAGLVAFFSLLLASDLDVEKDEITDVVSKLCIHIRHSWIDDKSEKHWSQYTIKDAYHQPGATNIFSWCSGESGMSRALWRAGNILKDEELCTFALESFARTLKDFKKKSQFVVDPSLCHGLAGLVQMSARFANETRETSFVEETVALTHRLLEGFEAGYPFGYRACEPGYMRIDSPWLFDGASGVALALLTMVRTTDPTWDRILLLT